MTKDVKKRYYPLRNPENLDQITLIRITEEQYRALYPEIWRTWKREHYHKRCICTKHYSWKCDGQCDLCEYHTSNLVSFDEPLPDGNGTLANYVPDGCPLTDDFVAERDLLCHLITRFRELDPDADIIIRLWEDHPEGISDRAVARKLGRPQRTFADQMKRYRKELHRLD